MSLTKDQLSAQLVREQELLIRFHGFLVDQGLASEGFNSARLALDFLEPGYSDTIIDPLYVMREAKDVRDATMEALNGR